MMSKGKDENLKNTLSILIQTWENEVIEFKEANDNFSTSDIGKYFSALSNEANLKDKESAWLVFGVRNKTRKIVGTDYRMESERLQSLKMQVSQRTEPSITFRNIHEVFTDGLRVILFENSFCACWYSYFMERSLLFPIR